MYLWKQGLFFHLKTEQDVQISLIKGKNQNSKVKVNNQVKYQPVELCFCRKHHDFISNRRINIKMKNYKQTNKDILVINININNFDGPWGKILNVSE